MADIYDNYSLDELDDILRCIDALGRAVAANRVSEKAGEGSELAIVGAGRVVQRLKPMGEERALRALAAVAYLTAVSRFSLDEIAGGIAARMVKQLRDRGDLPSWGAGQ